MAESAPGATVDAVGLDAAGAAEHEVRKADVGAGAAAAGLNAAGALVETIELDAYVVDTLMRDLVGHDRQPSAFLVYVHLWRRAGGGAMAVRASLQEIADATGLSKRAVQDAVGRLHRRRLVSIRREGITAVPEYRVLRPWAERSNPREREA